MRWLPGFDQVERRDGALQHVEYVSATPISDATGATALQVVNPINA